MNILLFQTLFMPGGTDPILPGSALSLFYLLLKGIFVLGAILYIIFSFVVVRQIHVMKSTVITPLSGFMTLLGFVHLLLALGVLFLFIAIL